MGATVGTATGSRSATPLKAPAANTLMTMTPMPAALDLSIILLKSGISKPGSTSAPAEALMRL